MGLHFIKNSLFQMAVAAVFLLSACVGGGGGPAGTPGAVGGGSSGLPGATPGTSLDGGGLNNTASGSGPVAMPAPDTVAFEPLTWEPYLMTCTNVPGPMVACEGKDGSVTPNSTIRLTAYPPGQPGGTPKYPSATTTADGMGAWNQLVQADAGDVVGICLWKNNTCLEVLYVVIPPEGGTVNGQQGFMKNLVIDKDGNKIFSKRGEPTSKPDSWYIGFSWKDFFISNAHAEEVEGLSYPILSNDLRWINIISQFEEEGSEGESGDVPSEGPVALTPVVDYKLVAAQCDTSTVQNFVFRSVEEENREVMPGNEASLKRAIPDASPSRTDEGLTWFPQVIATFPGYTRADIHDVAIWHPKLRPTEEYIGAAVGPHVYMVSNGETPSIHSRLDFGVNYIVSDLFPTDYVLYAFIKPKAGGSNRPDPLYAITINAEGEFQARCARTTEILPNVSEITDFEGVGDKVAFVAQMNDGTYVLVGGTPDRGSVDSDDITGVDLQILRTFDHPVEIAVLNIKDVGPWSLGGTGVQLIVHDRVNQSISLVDHDWFSPEAEVGFQTYTYNELGITGVQHLHNLVADPASGNVALLDIRESGAELINLYFSINASTNAVGTPVVTRYPLGQEAPTVVRRQDDAWMINSLSGRFVKVGVLAVNVPADIEFEGVTGSGSPEPIGPMPSFELPGDGDSDSSE